MVGLRSRRAVLAITVTAFFATMVARLVISPLVPNIITDFGVSTGRIGLALTGMWAAYAALQFPSGILGDRYGERRTIMAALALTVVGSGLLSWSPGYIAFALAAVFLGAGAGLYFSAATTFVAGLFENTGWALGLHSAGGPLAGLVAPLLATAVAARYGWRPALLVGAAVAAPVLLAYAVLVRPNRLRTPVDGEDDTASRGTDSASIDVDLNQLLGIVTRPSVAFTSLIAVLGYFAWQAVLSFFPAFLIAYHGLSSGTASLAFAGLFVLSAAGLPVLGRLSDRFRRDLVLGIAFTVSASAMALLLVGDGLFTIGIGVVFLGGGMGWAGVLNSRFMDLFGARERGTAFGLVRTIFLLLGSMGSVVTGTIVDIAGWPIAYGLVGGVLLLGPVAIVTNRVLGFDL